MDSIKSNAILKFLEMFLWLWASEPKVTYLPPKSLYSLYISNKDSLAEVIWSLLEFNSKTFSLLIKVVNISERIFWKSENGIS